MTYLLDTHVWLWLLADPDRIRSELLSELQDGRNSLLLSAASSWEISIKWSMGRLPLPAEPSVYLPVRMQSLGVLGLAVSHAHALEVASLEPHHRDPFDRLLIAQARVDDLKLVTADRAFEPYDVPLVWAA